MENIICENCGASNKPVAKYCSGCGYLLPKNIVETSKTEDNVDERSKPMQKRTQKVVSIFVGVIAFGASYFLVQHLFFSPSFDKVMMTAASEINKTCPIMVDQFTRLDNTVALPNNTFQYNYTLVSTEKSEVKMDLVKKNIEPGIINNVKTSPDLKIYRDNKTTMIYNYRDKNGVFVLKIVVTPEMYSE